jgi:hypothetical protein
VPEDCASRTCDVDACVPIAGLLLDEISANIASSHDLVELLVTAAGTTHGVTLVQDGSTVDVLATLPDLDVAAGDLIVVHLVPSGVSGIMPASETVSRVQYPMAQFAAAYDGAFDVVGGGAGITFTARVLSVVGPDASVLDAVPVVNSATASLPGAFPGDLQALQAAGLWLPADCGGMPCTSTSIPTAIDVSVDLSGSDASSTGADAARRAGFDTRDRSDWVRRVRPRWGRRTDGVDG